MLSCAVGVRGNLQWPSFRTVVCLKSGRQILGMGAAKGLLPRRATNICPCKEHRISLALTQTMVDTNLI